MAKLDKATLELITWADNRSRRWQEGQDAQNEEQYRLAEAEELDRQGSEALDQYGDPVDDDNLIDDNLSAKRSPDIENELDLLEKILADTPWRSN